MRYALAFVVPMLLAGCSSQSCPPGTRQSQVEGPFGPKNEWVCVSNPINAVEQPQATSPADAGSDASAPASNNGFGCEVADAYSADISMSNAVGEPPIVDGPTPDGTYDLAGATSYAGAAGTFPTMRARLRVSGSALVLGVQPTTPALGDVASLTMGLSNGRLTTVCAVGTNAATGLFPPAGATEEAHLSWDPKAGLLTMRLPRPNGDFDLIFVPFL